jgi:hypothetical protein
LSKSGDHHNLHCKSPADDSSASRRRSVRQFTVQLEIVEACA